MSTSTAFTDIGYGAEGVEDISWSYRPGSELGAAHASHKPARVPAIGRGVTPTGEAALQQVYRILKAERRSEAGRRSGAAPAVGEARRAFFAGR